ncbi:MAG: secretin and TonB N-terminal domain-containing protein [Limnochordia bacterium]
MNRHVLHVMLCVMLLVMVQAVVVADASQPPLVDLEFRDAEILDIYQVLGDLAGWNVVADQSVKGKFGLSLRATPLTQALDLVAQSTGFGYHLMGNTLVVVPASRLKAMAPRDFALLSVRHMALETAKALLEAGVPGVTVSLDQRQRAVLVQGTAAEVQDAQAVLAKYDVAPTENEFDFVDQSVAEILRTLAKSAGLNVLVEGAISGRLTIYLKDVSAREAINLVAERTGVVQEETADNILILRQGTAKPALVEPVDSRILPLKYLPLNTGKELIVAAFPRMDVRTGQGGNFLVVQGPASQLDAVEAFLAEQDFPVVRLVGLVQHDTGLRALLEIAGRSHIVREGQVLDDLVVERITQTSVVVRKGERTQTLTAGGAGQ